VCRARDQHAQRDPSDCQQIGQQLQGRPAGTLGVEPHGGAAYGLRESGPAARESGYECARVAALQHASRGVRVRESGPCCARVGV
jgi:hypothetical protein